MRLRSITTRTNSFEAMMPPQPDDPTEANQSQQLFLKHWNAGHHGEAKKEYIRFKSIMGQGLNKSHIALFDTLIKLDSQLSIAKKKNDYAGMKETYIQIKKLRKEEPDPKLIAKLQQLILGKKESVSEGIPDFEMAKAALAALSAIDTSSSQWRKTKRGSIKTQELEDLQAILSSMGYNPGKADGWFGKKTAKAVMQFQKDHGLTVDGDPGKNTINKMIDVIEKDFYGKDDDSDITATYIDKDGKDTGIPATRGKYGYDNYDMDKFNYDVNKAIDAAENLDEKQIWARSGQKVVRKYRCGAGIRRGRIVAKMSQCFAAPDLKKRFQLKRTRARLGGRMMRKAKRTKRVNPASRRVQALNRGR